MKHKYTKKSVDSAIESTIKSLKRNKTPSDKDSLCEWAIDVGGFQGACKICPLYNTFGWACDDKDTPYNMAVFSLEKGTKRHGEEIFLQHIKDLRGYTPGRDDEDLHEYPDEEK